MSEANEQAIGDEPLANTSELDSLKARADLMGLRYHPSIGVESLRAKIAAALNGEAEEEEEPQGDAPAANSSIPRASTQLAKEAAPVPETAQQRRARLHKEGRRKVRCRITCMNPLKKEWQGEQFCVSNRNIGSINIFVPFGYDWHVEAAVLNMIREREYLSFITKRVGPQQVEVKEHRLNREFAVEILDPLTPQELKELAQRQAMANGSQE